MVWVVALLLYLTAVDREKKKLDTNARSAIPARLGYGLFRVGLVGSLLVGQEI